MAREERGVDDLEDVGASGVPYREPFWDWLLHALGEGRDRKSASVGPVSERHSSALEEVRRELLKRRGLPEHGYSRQRVSRSTLLEIGIELLYAHVFGGRRIP